ncbi:hypothetical protein LCGC14_0960950 [marine sediment metagenome]|uniref:Uncharacterized protein n=1 Tax=marine sediment metagenome TaxID=412755 RepID=A0A0F9QXN9_9ZZZZ
MAGITQTAWVATTINGHLVLKCNLTQVSTALYDNFTLKTPKELDPTKSWLLFVNTTAVATGDGAGLPVDLWAGYDDNFALTGAASDVSVTSGYEVAGSIMDDVHSEKLASRIDPNYNGAVIQAATDTAGMINVGTAPYYAINMDDAGELGAVTTYIVITQ